MSDRQDDVPAPFPGVMRPATDSDSIPVRISPGEAIIPGMNGRLIHIRECYGDEPMQVTEIDLDDIEEERT